MKISRYTVEEPLEGGAHLLYHTASGAFAELDAAAYADLQAGAGPAAEELARWGFLTELSPEEELAALRERVDANRADHGVLGLSFVVTYACNFRCPYCYELSHNRAKGIIDTRVMDAALAFVEDRHRSDAFTTLSVQWYGGEPTLGMDAIEELSGRLIAWCEGHGVAYEALMLTNANAIGEHEADVIAGCRITNILLTIDGPEELHNKRRVAQNGTNSYQRTLEAARLLRARGVQLSASMNVDRISWPLFPATRDKMLAEEGIFVNAGRLCDYEHSFGTPPYAKPDFDLFTHEEFCQARLEQFAGEPHTAAQMRELLQPNRQFCSGQSGDYYVIDCLGDVYNCDGWVGDKAFVKFNLLDGPDTWPAHAQVAFDPVRDETCGACAHVPICMGSCIWERTLTGMPCYPLKDHFGAYLRIYRDCFGGVEAGPHGFTLLAAPVEDVAASCFGGVGDMA